MKSLREEKGLTQKTLAEQLNLRLRGSTPNQQIIMAFNPISKNHWLHDFCEVSPPNSFIFIHSTYKDNPFLNAEYIAELEEDMATIKEDTLVSNPLGHSTCPWDPVDDGHISLLDGFFEASSPRKVMGK